MRPTDRSGTKPNAPSGAFGSGGRRRGAATAGPSSTWRQEPRKGAPKCVPFRCPGYQCHLRELLANAGAASRSEPAATVAATKTRWRQCLERDVVVLARWRGSYAMGTSACQADPGSRGVVTSAGRCRDDDRERYLSCPTFSGSPNPRGRAPSRGRRADCQQEGSAREEMIESVIYKFKLWLMNVSACEPCCGGRRAHGWASLRPWAILRL
jgi:hypothetical protein